MGAVLEFPKMTDSTGPKFCETPTRNKRRLYIGAEEGRRRLLAVTLPPRSVVLSGMHFSESEKPLFPPDLRICGSLTLFNCHGVTKLGDGLQVEGNADFTGTPITRLPRRFRVMGYLSIIDTKIMGVPRDLRPEGGVIVGEDASASLKALAVKQPVKWMSPVVNF